MLTSFAGVGFRMGWVRAVFLLGVFVLFSGGRAYPADLPEYTDLDRCPRELVQLYLYLAEWSMLSYHLPEEEMCTKENGCAALVRMDYDNNLIIAFRGSVLPFVDEEFSPTEQLIKLMRLRSYQDWFQTNLRQALGMMPLQYIEAAELIVEQIKKHPYATNIYVTGHSKGGGLAEGAIAAAWLSEEIPFELKKRMMAVSFNGAVVSSHNWDRLYEGSNPALVDWYLRGNVPRVDAVIMRDDFVPKADWRSRRLRPFVNLVVIRPTRDLWATQQHSISVVIDELRKRAAGLVLPTY